MFPTAFLLKIIDDKGLILCRKELLLTTSSCSFSTDNINPLPYDKNLGLFKSKAFADDKLNVIQNIKVVCHRIENIVGKEENAGYQHFFFSHSVFQRLFPPVHQKSSFCGKRLSL